MREIWLAVVIMCGLAGIGPVAAQPAASDAKPAAAGGSSQNVLAVNDADHVLGKADAPITIVEYASLSCPHCAHFESTVLPKLKEKWIDTGKAKLVLRDFPLDQPAMQAAMLAHCVPAERYYPLVESLFSTQEKWVIAKDPKAALEKLTRFAGIGPKEFDACLGNTQVQNQVAQSRLTATQQLGVDSTPTFFVNGKKFEGDPTFEAMDQLLLSTAPKS
ncbi:MAG TPA: DsbA family protein [Stellaceae bacterium]|jgi:protein-disulfide isomerase|nr:DsbA family protein [Stellaceae bacterium]